MSFIGLSAIHTPEALCREAGTDGTTSARGKENAVDHGGTPWIADIEEITLENDFFREAKWTGNNIQLTLMSIPPGGEIGGEVHPANDQFIRIESGTGRAMMGKSKNDLMIDEEVSDDWVLLIPSGYWHNLVNTGDTPLKLYAIYGPPEHPKGTVHKTHEEAEAAHHDH
ncbi:MAG: cupin domain-containing protein [Candidatus Omnitrophica bacterium]|nr:cupin domain-containing protein [Candidatus Omnitrophota bacterium]